MPKRKPILLAPPMRDRTWRGWGAEAEEDRKSIIIKDASISGLEWGLSGDHTVKQIKRRLPGQL